MKKLSGLLVSIVFVIAFVFALTTICSYADDGNARELPEQVENINALDSDVTSNEIIEDEGSAEEELNKENEVNISEYEMLLPEHPSPEQYADYIKYNCIDVSELQDEIDWEKVKEAGITHVLIRGAFQWQKTGNLQEDARFKENIERAYNAGISVGVYIFSQAISVEEAIEQANFIAKVVEPYRDIISMPVIMDYEFGEVPGGRFPESKGQELGKEVMTQICEAFCEQIKLLGYTPMIYANAKMLINYIDRDYLTPKYPIWLAHWTSKATDYARDFLVWQYSSSGNIDGINGRVDLDILYVQGVWEKNGNIWKFKKVVSSYDPSLDGSYAVGWMRIVGTWYYFNGNGEMLTGFQNIDGKLYYFDEGSGVRRGSMCTGPRVINGKLYNIDANGVVHCENPDINNQTEEIAQGTVYRSVNTGDDNNIGLLIVLMVFTTFVALINSLYLNRYRKRYKIKGNI